MFDNLRQRVVLIRKNKPEWQRGMLNGVGGKVEFNEDPAAAMAREFYEETGVSTYVEEWQYFCRLHGDDEDEGRAWEVHFFVCIGDPNFIRYIEQTGGAEEEQVEVVNVISIFPGCERVIGNLPWLIPLALDMRGDGRPGFVDARYPKVKI